jgi:putative transposase
VLEARRQIAARLLAQGDTVTKVAAAVDASVSSVKRWKESLAQGGTAALASKPHQCPRPRLTPAEHRHLLEALKSGAEGWGFPSPEWNCPRVKALIGRLFQVDYHVDYVGTLLHQLGWSVQKPAHRAREQDKRALKRWRQVEWPQLKKEDRTSS